VTAFGVSPLGTDLGPFGGPGIITVLGVSPLGNNRLVVFFDRPPRADDPGAAKSVTNPRIYALRVIDPTYISATTPAPGIVPPGAAVPVRTAAVVEATQSVDDPTQIILATDCMLEPGLSYELEIVQAPCGAEGESFAGPTTWTIRAGERPRAPESVEIVEERYRDFDYVFAPAEGETPGSYRLDSDGDIGLQPADASLRKRIYRRIFSPKGAFAVLSASYGVGVRDKALTTPGRLQELASTAAEQIRLEPDVAGVGLEAQSLRTSSGTFVTVTVFVRRRDGRSVRFEFRRPVGG
jgi:hypothetical protein